MKRYLSPLICFILLAFIITSCAKENKKNEVKEKFEQELAMPEFTLITLPDSTIVKTADIDKSGIVMIKYFSPDCDHCQKDATSFVSRKEDFKNIKTIWMSCDWASLEMLKTFADTYGLDQVNPMAIGKNDRCTLIPYYDIKGVPYSVVYKDNQFIREYRGNMNYSELKSINDGTFVPVPKATLLKSRKKS